MESFSASPPYRGARRWAKIGPYGCGSGRKGVETTLSLPWGLALATIEA